MTTLEEPWISRPQAGPSAGAGEQLSRRPEESRISDAHAPSRVFEARGGTHPYERFMAVRRLLDAGICATRADAARFLGVSRARITILLRLDKIEPAVWDWLLDSPHRTLVSERVRQEIGRLPPSKQLTALKTWCSWRLKE